MVGVAYTWYFQHTGDKNTSHDCYKIKAKLIYIVNTRPARATQRDNNSREEGDGRKQEREGGEEEGREGKQGRIKQSQEWNTQLTTPTLKLKQEILGSRSA